ncbi:MAG: hypothetical protein ACRDAM_15755 [Casimicrobium sp.]
MKLALYGLLRFGEINTALPASATNFVSQAVRFFEPQCHSEFTLGISVEKYKSENGCSGINVVDFIRTKKREVTAKATFDEGTHANLRAFVQATTTVADTAAVPVSGYSLNAVGVGAFAPGDVTYLGRMNITSLAITAVTPASPVAGTHYELDPVFGRIKWLAAITGPVTANFSYQNPITSAIMNAPEKDYVAILDGYNADGNAPGQVVLYKTKPILSGDLALTTDEKSTMSVDMEVVADTSKAFGGLLGQFGFIRGFGLPDK